MPRVLVAEDSKDDRELFETFLQLDGFTAATVTTTDALVAAARSPSPPDVILLDLILDRLNGLEVVETLRSDPRTATIPVVAITAATPPYVEEIALKVGCNAFLTKPCAPERVIEALRATLGETPRST